ncbi:MAG: acetate kinase [Bacillota bacterium]|nr:acetate kinase [Bacillota bacterium]
MKILVINAGSSTVKYQLINMEDDTVMAKGICDRIGNEGSNIEFRPMGRDKIVVEKDMPTHAAAVKIIMEFLTDPEIGVIKSMSEIYAVGHRVVHGGEYFNKSVIITDEVKKAVEACIPLAPLHNPANLTGILACEEAMPGVPMVAVFDTAFHQTMPREAYMYALPMEMYQKHKIRKYGFHGTSHKYVSERCAALMGRPIEELKIITCHLGSGASVCAIKGGKSVDTSMGFTPLDGLVMGTRCGSIDPAVVTHIMEVYGLSTKEVNDLLNKKSGVLGVSEIGCDFRDLELLYYKGNERAILALDMSHYSIKKFIGSYIAAMGGVDAIVFTAGVGENNAFMRKEVLKAFEYLGVKVDDERNNVRGKEREITTEDSKVKGFLIPTNEELAIALETQALVK